MNRREVKRAPVLRFKGFTNDWEQHKLGDETNRIKSYSISHGFEVAEDTGTKYIHYGDIHTSKVKNINNIDVLPNIKDNNYKPLKYGDVIVADASEDYKGIADACIVNTISDSYKIVAGLHTIAFRPKSKLCSKFLYFYLSTDIFKHFGYKTGTGLKVFGISYKELAKFKLKEPSVTEQKKIVKLLFLIEKAINLQQRKLKLLKVMKKALSQYMFCQETEFVPILRFNSFSDKWKYERLKKLIVKEIKGKAKADMKGTKSTYIDTALLNGGSITKVDSPTDTFHNDIIILWDGSQAGKIYHGFTGALGSTLKSYKPKYSGGFLYQYLKSKEPIIFLRYRTPNIPHVIKDFTEIFKINVPSVKEQEKISKTLNYLDQRILVETKKIGSIKKIKKFLLQNMFI